MKVDARQSLIDAGRAGGGACVCGAGKWFLFAQIAGSFVGVAAAVGDFSLQAGSRSGQRIAQHPRRLAAGSTKGRSRRPRPRQQGGNPDCSRWTAQLRGLRTSAA